MITVRRGAARGHTRLEWLDSRHTFSFGEYVDRAHMGFGPLRVINDDRVVPGRGFGTHGHRDMEILTWVLTGALAHQDSLGTGSVIRPGDAQLMTAGSGIRHSEFEHSGTEAVHLLQNWIEPDQLGLAPGYQQRAVDEAALHDRWCPIAAPGGREGALTLHQDALVLATRLDPGSEVTHPLSGGRRAWLHVARGHVRVGAIALEAGDGAALRDESVLTITASAASEVLAFDLPPATLG